MSLRIEKRAKFREDFINQFWWYVKEAGDDVARNFQIGLDETIKRLADNPTIGRPRHFKQVRLEGLRSFPVEAPFKRFLIFYRFDGNSLEITRLVEGSRNLSRRLAGSD